MYNDEDWVNKASGFLTDLFDEVSRGFQTVADEIEKSQFVTGQKSETTTQAPSVDSPEPKATADEPKARPFPPYGRPRPVGGHHPMPRMRHAFDENGKRLQTIHADFIDHDDSIEICAILPGFSKDNIDICLKGEELKITATKDWESVADKDKYVFTEQRYGKFVRSFPIGKVDSSSIRATYKDGLLSISITKLPEATPSKIVIE